MSQKSTQASTNKYYIYIIEHPKFKGWIKLGRTVNLKSRLDGYQTGCPFREYKMVYNKYIPNSILVTTIENYFKLNIHNNGFEWFECTVENAISIIERMVL